MRVRKKLTLSEAERSELRKLVKNGRHSASEISHARILLDLDENSESRYTQKEIAERNHVCIATVMEISRRFLAGGIEMAGIVKKSAHPSCW